MDYRALIAATAGRALGALGDEIALALSKYLPHASISTPLRLAHFIAQASEETGGFEWMTELGSDAYFHRYDGRADLGNTQPGDGARFKGRGIFQITGRANYIRYGKRIGVDLVDNPEIASTPDIAVQTAVAYWLDRGLNALADKDDVIGITRRINGGLNGLSGRKLALSKAKAYLAANPESYPPLPAPPPKKPLPVIGTAPITLASAPLVTGVVAQAHSPALMAVVVAIAVALAFTGVTYLILTSRKHHMATIPDTAAAVESAATALTAAATELNTAAGAIAAAITAAGSSTALDQPLADLATAVTAVTDAANAVKAAVPA